MKILQDQVKKYAAGAKEERRPRPTARPRRRLAAAKAPYDAARERSRRPRTRSRAGGMKKVEEGVKKGTIEPELLNKLTEAQTAVDKVEGAYDDAKADYDEADAKAKNYKASQRVFEAHIARIEIAIRCGANAECYAGALTATFESVKGELGKYIAGLDAMNEDEKKELLAAQIERAMLELGKMGGGREPDRQAARGGQERPTASSVRASSSRCPRSPARTARTAAPSSTRRSPPARARPPSAT
jgi:hypothetical protein